MKQSEITVRVDLHRGAVQRHGLDLRPVLRLRQASTPTTAVGRDVRGAARRAWRLLRIAARCMTHFAPSRLTAAPP